MVRLLLIVALVAAVVPRAPAASIPPGKVIQVVLHPAVPPSPILKYPLLPELRQQTPGNAVPLYRECVKRFREKTKALDVPQWQDVVEKWMQEPPEKFPREQARAFFAHLEPALKDVEFAARHEYADWELTDKLRERGIGTLLPDVQEMREFAVVLVARSRLAQLEGRIDDALNDLQTVFAMSRHVAHSPTLICMLIGNSGANRACQQVTELLEDPKTPNLYWSLTDLPQPFLDMRLPLQGERLSAYGTFPGLTSSPKDPRFRLFTEKDADNAVRLIRGIEQDAGFQFPDVAYSVRLGLDVQRKHESAKKAIIAAGWPADLVAKMPHLQVALLHGFLEYDRELDELMKLETFPYWQARAAIEEQERRLLARRRKPPAADDPAIDIVRTLMPANSRLVFGRTRLERKIASLRVIEALRLYAAKHDGQLPARLDDIKDVPIPVDPYTGKPFDYTRDGDKATLSAPALAAPGRPVSPQDALTYSIEMKK
jgi:hypothetical protein